MGGNRLGGKHSEKICSTKEFLHAVFNIPMNQRKVNQQKDVEEFGLDSDDAQEKVRRARLVLKIVMVVGIILPFVLFLFIHGWPFH